MQLKIDELITSKEPKEKIENVHKEQETLNKQL